MYGYIIEFNGANIKEYKSRKRAIAYAISRDSEEDSVRVWSPEGLLIWSNRDSDELDELD